MEHLTLPKYCSVQELTPIQYKCQRAYDGGDFLTYPSRMGVTWTVTTEQMHDSIYRRKAYEQARNHDLEPSLQEWLFFGLINEMLGAYVSRRDLIRRTATDTGSTEVLSTSTVLAAVQQWVKATQSQPKKALPEYEHFADCLQLLWANLTAFQTLANEELIMILASLGELFSFTIEKIFEELPKERKDPKTWLSIIHQDYWVKKMKMSRFCPCQIAATLNASNQIHAIHFIVHMEQPEILGRHDLCSDTACFAWQNGNPAAPYRNRHRWDNCSCTFIEALQTDLAKILEEGYIPLLRFSSHASIAEIELEIVSSKDYPKYLALSHVWTDGLGNWQQNALPRCQLDFLRTLVNTLRPSLNLSPDQELLLWCDTMCCPVGPVDLKTLALEKMKRIYQEASCVLVLDNSLRCYDSLGIQLREVAFRIVTSAWSRRLWTLQEAMLSTPGARLWFQFHDKAINIQTIVDSILGAWRTQIIHKASAYDLMARTGDYFTLFSNPITREGNIVDFSLVTEILQNRSVSVPADEALLIGNFLDLDVVEILKGQSSATRMRYVWDLISKTMDGIPTIIIFWIGPRLLIPGYRWAPATLLHSYPDNLPLNKIRTKHNDCEISPDGLRLRLGGCSFRRPHGTGVLQKLGKELIQNSQMNLIYVRREDGTWFSLMPRLTGATESYLASEAFHYAITEPKMWLIRASWRSLQEESGLKEADTTQIGLLVKESSHESGVKMVRSHYHVCSNRVTGALLQTLEAAYKASEEILQGPTAILLSKNENWTLDMDQEDTRAKLQTLFTEVEQVVDKIDQNLLQYVDLIAEHEKQGRLELAKQVFHFVLGMYGCLGDETADTQEWCVD